MPKKIMFDSNAIDRLSTINLGDLGNIENYEFYVPVTLLEELASMPDEKKELRILNLITYAVLRPIMVISSVSIFDHSRFDLCRFGEGEVYSKILNGSGSNINDAIIADTSVTEGCTLVTNDVRLFKKMRSNDYSAMLFDDFIKEISPYLDN